MIQKSKKAFRTISETAEELDVPQHVLRFWETKFSQIKPMKRGGNRRYYRRSDIDLLKAIQHQLYDEEQTIKGVQKMIRDQGLKVFIENWKASQPQEAVEEPPVEAPVEPAPEQVQETRKREEVLFETPAPESEPKTEPEPQEATPAAKEDDDSIRVSKDLVRALVDDLKALRSLIDRMPD